MKKAVAYYRVSSKRQGKSGLGLDAQRKAVRDFAAMAKMTIVAEFMEVESGKKNDRPVLSLVLAACGKHDATLLIAKLDRLARRLIFIATLMESSVRFISVDKPHADEYELHIDAANAQRESKLISQRTKEALQAAKRRGIKLGTSVKGLLRARRRKYKLFAKKLKPTIKRFQKMGFTSVRALVKILNDKKIKTVTGGSTKWHVSTVHKLLKQL
jgi:DNA invertase Pin-like site-specific DNA recombinase